jgi:DNA-binding MarR family transcriptional regulator
VPPGPSRLAARPGAPAPSLTEPQRRTLAALVELSPPTGGDVSAREVAQRTGDRLATTVLVLRGLAAKRLVVRNEAEGDEERWAPTLTGRARVRPVCARSLEATGDEDGRERWPASAMSDPWPPSDTEP